MTENEKSIQNPNVGGNQGTDSTGSSISNDFFEVKNSAASPINSQEKSAEEDYKALLEQEKLTHAGATKRMQSLEKQNALMVEQLKQMGDMMKAQQQFQEKQYQQPEPKDVFEALGIDKDEFVYDSQEAMTDPTSESARVQRAVTQMNILPTLKQQQENWQSEYERKVEQQSMKIDNERRIAEFRQAKGLTSDEVWDDFVKYAETNPYTLDTAFQAYLSNKNSRDFNMATNSSRDINNQQTNAQNLSFGLPRINGGQPRGAKEPTLMEVLGKSSKSQKFF